MSSAVNLRVKVHPSVLFQITDAYERRNVENHRVIGTLIGKIKKKFGDVPSSRHEILPLMYTLRYTMRKSQKCL